MKTETLAFQSGGLPSKRRQRKPFPFGAPRALIAPLDALLESARTLSGADRAAAFVIEGRDVSLVAEVGGEDSPHRRLAARALAQGKPLTELKGDRYAHAIPVAATPPPMSERRRFKPRWSVVSACLVIEGQGEAPSPDFSEDHIATLGRSLIATIESRAFADAIATDRTTGALNRAAFERAAMNELTVADAADHPAALLLLEVMPRRQSVDVETAEEAITVGAAALRKALRDDDLVGRRGPDELVALLVNSDPAHLAVTVQRVLQQVETALDALGLEAPSLGAASFPLHGTELEDLDRGALDALEGARTSTEARWKIYDPQLGPSPTSCRKSFLTGDPSRDTRKASLLLDSILAANSATGSQEALDAVLRALFAATGADRAAVLSGDGGHLDVAAARDHRWHKIDPPLRFSRSACLRALALGRATCVSDTNAADEEIGQSAQELRLRSVVTVPLLGRDGPLGVLYADSLRPSFHSYGPEDLAYLEVLAAQASLAIENAGVREALEEENAALIRATRASVVNSPLIGKGPAMAEALQHLPEIIASDSPTLILGESGTGKDVVARTLHALGPRSKGNLITQNCAAIPSDLLESELFGHCAGAFSGATKAKRGLLELADGGTFFLDEVGDLSPALQAKLLRVLEDKEIRRLGETRARKVDFRIVCATNRDIEKEVEEARFRRDLFYRIHVFTVKMPPLRHRREDIPELALHFIGEAATKLGRPLPRLSNDALAQLCQARLPGNVRELRNMLEKAVALAHSGIIEAKHLGLDIAGSLPATSGPLRELLARVERDAVAAALAENSGNVSAASRSLGIARQQMQRLVRKYGLKPGPA